MSAKVTGMGLVCSLGRGVQEVYSRMCAGECGFRPITRFDGSQYAQPQGGALPQEVEDYLADAYPGEDLTLAMMMCAAEEALAQAGESAVAPERQGIVLATNFGLMETLEWCWQERMDSGAMPAEDYAVYDGVLATVAERLGCRGPRLQLSMSCASGAAAASAAADVIAQGRAERMIVIAFDALSEYAWCGLSNLRTITTDLMRPFDPKRSGTIFSEGAAAVILESSASDGKALAWLAGSATNNNAFHMTAPPKDAEGSRRVMAQALAQAGVAPQEIEHVCAHATSTHANDETEAGALRNLFGEHLKDMTVAAHKSQLGHLLGAAGLAEAVMTVQSMRGGMIPPTIHHEEDDPACGVLDCVAGGTGRIKAFDVAITNSAGIGGNNGSLVLTRRQRSSSRAPRSAAMLYVRSLAWVLPAGAGKGRELLDHPEWITWRDGVNDGLAGFSAKGYLKSVKGYLDPAGGYQLAAMAMALGDSQEAAGLKESCGICTGTRYGACGSAYRFYEQMRQKGPRFASPLIFPHGYANTAGNLAAIEFGFGGPHLVLSGAQDPRELLEFAAARLGDGTATEMLVGVVEAGEPMALPDGCQALNGALALRVSATPAEEDILTIPLEPLRRMDEIKPLYGMTAAMGMLLGML